VVQHEELRQSRKTKALAFAQKVSRPPPTFPSGQSRRFGRTILIAIESVAMFDPDSAVSRGKCSCANN
jgi:hypothetical protein